jgi:type IX secretion system PorP/SprF family membrane protein
MNIKYLHKRIIFKFIIAFFAFFTEGSLLNAQQEGNHTLFMYNPLIVNPGAAGISGYSSYTVMHRSQWLGFKGAPMMQTASVSTPAFSDRLGFGLTLQNRKVGIFETQTISMAWAYSLIKTTRFNCRAGLQGVVKRTALRFNDLEEASLFLNDRSVVPTVSSRFVSNFGLGIYMTFDDAFLGFSIPSYLPNVLGINPFSATTAAESAHFYGQGGLKLKLTEGVKFQPSAMVKWVKNAPWSLDVNASLIVNDKITLGMSYRVGRTTLATIGESADLTFLLKVNDQLSIGAAYDWLLAPVSKYSYGSAEVMIRYDIKHKKEVVFSNPRSFF